MVKMLRMILGIPPSKKANISAYKIKPIMVSPDVIVMDMNSFRNSKKVQRQVQAARRYS
ncbi:hypothetical protein VIBNISOn1_1840001 [Vibrio nigripulchritudo SOn1]|uniref:Uncharacterized protein n=1 Tax=Vibrio nigripulchritudo SOn1 TaxID=1238450 RepID=A0AAV2VQA5_9VIBR|nr:hypothetical protein VIBNISOn1_1840001 [Vibrio nigripulchritudo SOn1]